MHATQDVWLITGMLCVVVTNGAVLLPCSV